MTTQTKHIITAAALILLAAFFSLGRSYERSHTQFRYHEINVTGGGVALVVPRGWDILPVWNERGRPYIRPTDREGWGNEPR